MPIRRNTALAAIARALDEHHLVDGVCASCRRDDEAVRALSDALDEIERTRFVRTEAGAKRYGLPIGSPIGGEHVPAAAKPPAGKRKSRLVAAIEDHLAGDGKGNPLEGFSREQLRRVAKDRGIALDRGEPHESIAKKLIDHVRGDAPVAKKAASKQPKVRLEGMERLADAVDNQPIKAKKELSGGQVAQTDLVTYANGVKAVRKVGKRKIGNNDPKAQADAEVLAAKVGRKLGVQSPLVYRSESGDPDVVHMEYVAAAKHPNGMFGWHPQQDSNEGRLVALFDTLIANPDRHTGNWLIKNGHVVPIDNGYAFDDRTFYLAGGLKLGWHVPTDYFTGADFDEVERRMKQLRPEFVAAGRTDWYRSLISRLRTLRGLASRGSEDKLPPELP